MAHSTATPSSADGRSSLLRASIIRGTDGDAAASRAVCEQDLDARGFALPFTSRLAWARQSGATPWFLAVHDRDGRCVYGCGIDVYPSRALPLHSLLRLRRMPTDAAPEVLDVVADAISGLAREQPRVLAVTAETFARDPERRAALASRMVARGFRREATVREYAHTLVVDLAPAEEALYASMPRVKKNIKQIDRFPFERRVIDLPGHAPRMAALFEETMRRTGGGLAAPPFEQIIAVSNDAPALSRLVGLFRTGSDAPDAMVAFAWACFDGDYAHYDVGASTREGDVAKLSLAYPLLWDAIAWAKRGGASWFDLGGVSAGSLHTGDPLGGISDFKRAFSKQLADVGEDWVLEPHGARTRIARGMSSGARSLSRVVAEVRGRMRPTRVAELPADAATPTAAPTVPSTDDPPHGAAPA